MSELGTVRRSLRRLTVTIPSRRRPVSPGRRKLAALRRVRMLAPLQSRDFALLWTGMAVSLIGDGIYFVAIVWEALRLSNTAIAVSLTGVAWTVPTLACLLLGGTLSDRFDRRRLMLLAGLSQAAAIGAIGLLDLSGALQMWTLLCLVAAYGAGQAFFLPAFEALVPTLVEPDELVHASALDQFVRPLSLQLIGPALGGVLIALAGTAPAFLLDAATFLFGAGTLLAMRSRRSVEGSTGNSLQGLGEAFRFVRANAWLWTTLVAAALTLLLFIGPYQVLLPFLVKNTLHGSSATLGLIRALGGVGALVAALSVSQLGLPGWAIRAMFLGWAVQSLALAGYAVAHEAWLFAGISLLGGAGGAVGNVVWGTLMKTRVPNRLLGRVASLDWLVSIALVPLSFALTGPVAGVLGARATLLLGGVVSAGTLLAFLLVARSERRERRVRAGEIRTAASAT